MNAAHPLSIFILLAPAFALAADPNVNLDAIVVTAHPVVEEVHLDDFSATSAIVTATQLRDQNAVDLASALRRTPGVQISRYNPVGGHGGDQGGAVYIRAMGVSRPGSEIKTYIDGIPVYMGVWSHPLLDLLPVNGMQSIVVYKSPQPQINGNNFASVNLSTKSAPPSGIHGSGRVTAGSFGTITEQLDLSGRQGDIDFTVAQGHAKSNGHRTASDGELNNMMGRVTLKANANWSIGVSGITMKNRSRDPGDNRIAANPTPPEYRTKADILSAFLQHRHGDWQGEFRAYSNDGYGNLYNDLVWGTFLTGFRMSGLRWKEEFSPWRGAMIEAGVDHDRVSGDVQGPNTGGKVNMPSFRLTSPHVALSQKIEVSHDWSLVPSAGVRFYDHSQYASRSAPHAGLSLVSEKLTVFANTSRGISYPGLEAPALQAALPFMFAGTTWGRLSAEELDHSEVGIKLAPWMATQIDISVFRDAVRNRFVYDLAFGSTTFYNLGTYRVSGSEISIRHRFGDEWGIFAGITSLGSSINNLPYAPRQAFTLGINGRLGPVRMAIDAQGQSEVWALNRDRNNLNPNLTKVGGFGVVNARVSHPVPSLGAKGEVFLAMENLFDRTYAYRPGYLMPGRSAQIGLSASF